MLVAGGGVPDSGTAGAYVAAAAGQQLLAVDVVITHTAFDKHLALVAFEGGVLFAGGGVPDPDRAVVAAAGPQPLAVDGDRAHGVDPVLVAFQGGVLLAGGGVPDPHRPVFVAAAGQQLLAVDGDRA